MKNSHFKLLLILSMLLWGGGWSALKVLTYNLDADVIIFWRFFLMSLSFVPVLFYFKEPFKITKNSTRFILASSVLNIAFMVSSFFGIKHGLAASGGVIITTLSPIMTFLLIYILFRKKLHHYQTIGLAIGLLGGYIMLGLDGIEQFLYGGNIYFLLCATIWAGVTLLSQYSHHHIHPVHYSFAISVIATVASFIYAYDSNLSIVFKQDIKFWISLIYLAVFGQTIATTIYFIASAKLGSQSSSSFMFLVPVFAVVIAYAVLGEVVGLNVIIGGAFSIVAVYFINKKVT